MSVTTVMLNAMRTHIHVHATNCRASHCRLAVPCEGDWRLPSPFQPKSALLSVSVAVTAQAAAEARAGGMVGHVHECSTLCAGGR